MNLCYEIASRLYQKRTECGESRRRGFSVYLYWQWQDDTLGNIFYHGSVNDINDAVLIKGRGFSKKMFRAFNFLAGVPVLQELYHSGVILKLKREDA